MILGHERQINYFAKILKNGKLAHAYFFHGPRHIGKTLVAERIAQALYCEQKSDGLNPCLECRECREVRERAHPNVFFLNVDHPLVETKKEKRSDISIDDIRELRRRFSLGLPGEQWRIAIVEDAEAMSQPAVNALLKSLEEPGARTLYFLTSSAPELVPETIISRAQAIRFSPVSDIAMEEFFKKSICTAVERSDMLKIAKGRPGVIFGLLAGGGLLEKERTFAAECDSALKDIPHALSFGEKYAFDGDMSAKAIDHALFAVRERMRGASTPSEVLDFARRLKKMLRVASLLETTNVNARLGLDVFFLEAIL